MNEGHGGRPLLGALLACALVATPSFADPRVLWFDLLTEDAEAAARFYHRVFDWRFERQESGNFVAVVDDVAYAGISQIETSSSGVDEASWLVGVEVDDVSTLLAKAESLGATVLRDTVTTHPLADWGVLRDPQGAELTLIDSKTRIGGVEGNGTPYWAELWSRDAAASGRFYVELMGWELSSTERSGERYPFFGTDRDPLAGLLPIGDDIPGESSGWATYFAVESLGSTLEKVRKAGGRVLLEPDPEIDGGALAIVEDSTGVAFVVVEMRKEE